MGPLKICIALIASAIAVCGQSNFDTYAYKGGSCPPPLPVRLCTKYCAMDSECFGKEKCCSTYCGGSICTTAVTMRNPMHSVKAGSCPTPAGRWICSSTCSVDSDCRGTNKCCRNRCGALVCQKPSVEIVPLVEIVAPKEPEVNNNIGNYEPYVPNINNPFLLNTHNNDNNFNYRK